MASRVWLFFALVFCRALWAQDCPDDSFYVNEIGKCVHPDNDVSPMAYAELYCQAFGGHLLSIHNTFNNALLTGVQLTRLNGDRGFLGAKRATNGSWWWSDGTPFDYMKWAPGEPKTGDCVYLDSNDYNWRSIDCFTTLPYLCALPNVTQPDCTTPAPNPISCPIGSRYIQETQSCLHADNNVVSFYLAEKYCKAYNGHLFSIHDGDTDDLLTGISFTLINGDQFYIGGQKNGSTFTWTDGTPFDYVNWASDEPKLECAIIRRETASWMTIDCSTALPFMCQIPPIYNGGCTMTPIPTTPPPNTVETDATSPAICPTTAPLNCQPVQSQPLYNCYSGWQCSPITGYSYLVFTNSSTFSQAEAYCVNLGGHLASIHSSYEDDFISGLCCSSDCSFRTSQGWASGFVTGAQKVNNVWAWTDGTPWDYQQQICDEGGSDFILTTDDDCTGNCGEDGFGGWVSSSFSDVPSQPYYACKKKTF